MSGIAVCNEPSEKAPHQAWRPIRDPWAPAGIPGAEVPADVLGQFYDEAARRSRYASVPCSIG